MSLKEDLDTLSPAEEVQKAFDDSSSIELGSLKLNPWTIARHSAAMSLGCSVISAVGPDARKFYATGHYSNVFRDVVISMWVCSLDDHQVIRLNYSASQSDIEQAFEWANAIGLVYGSNLYIEGVARLDNIVSGVLASFYAIEGNQPDAIKKKEDTSQHGKSSSPTAQRKRAAKQRATS